MVFFLAECLVVEGFSFLEISKHDAFLGLKKVFLALILVDFS